MNEQYLPKLSRRDWLARAAAVTATFPFFSSQLSADEPNPPALIAITLDLEMSQDYPQRGLKEWNFQKGNLDDATKQYAVEAARRVKAAGGVIHFFCVGRVLEQSDVEWLKQLHAEGHPIGNHTYDHVNVKARMAVETQFRFQRSPWLVEGRSAEDVIRENIRLTTVALKERCDISARGFRTPGGFHDSLGDRPDVQQWLLDEGFRWVSSKYPVHETGKPGEAPTEAVYDSITGSVYAAQPFVYRSGLVEIPMSPISDVTAFRSNRWKREWFLEAIRRSVTCAIDSGQVFDFLAHPSCLCVEDPEFESIDLICKLVNQAGAKAKLASLDEIAERALVVPQP